jgi:DNA-binding transcriptional MocR family regulator
MDALLLDRSIPTALHLQLSDHLRSAIRAGRLPAGDVLPPEPLFAVQLGVARGTVRQAIQQLVREGLLERQRGHGTYVIETGADQSSTTADAATLRSLAYGGAEGVGEHESPAALAMSLGALRTELFDAVRRQDEREAAFRQENNDLRDELRSLRAQLGEYVDQIRTLQAALDAQLSGVRPRRRDHAIG